MENRRPSSPRKGPVQGYSIENRDAAPRYGDHRRNGPARTGDNPRYGSGPGNRSKQSNARDGYYSKPGGNFRGRPGERRGPSKKPWEKEKPRVTITSDLQITDGKYQGQLLQNSVSPSMSPTKRRLRELFFKILIRKVRGGRFLDLCAGSGMIGLEAISRGAMLGTFVDRSARMATYIKKNVEACGIKTGHAEVLQNEAVPFLKQMSKRRRYWDVVYFCPPTDGSAEDMYKYLRRGATVAEHGVLAIEHPSETVMPDDLGILKKSRTLKIEDSTLSFYERRK